MNLLELSALMQDEKKCEEYLINVGILKTFTNCIKCGSEKIGAVRRNRYKCYQCKYEWHVRKRSVLILTKLEFSTFLATLKFFADEYSIVKCAKELNLSRQIVTSIYKVIRICLSSIDFVTFKLLNRKNTQTAENPSIMIIDIGEKIEIQLTNEKNANHFQNIGILNSRRTRNANNQIYYEYFLKHPYQSTDQAKTYDSVDRFWSYAYPKLQYQNISQELNLFLCLKELEYRYQYSNNQIFEFVVTKIAENEWVAHCLPEVGI
jgi:transposase